MTSLEKLSYQHPILFYDGVCNFCSGFVKFIIRRDKNSTFRFCTLQDDLSEEVNAQSGLQDNLESVLALKDGIIYTKSDVSFLILKELGGFWKLLLPLQLLPKILRDSIYGIVVKNRYRLFGKKDQCEIPPPHIRNRFLLAEIKSGSIQN